MTEETLGSALDRLLDVASKRRGGDPDTSYTAKLLNDGTARCAKKFGEEAVEVVIAAAQEDHGQFCDEVADVLYHLSVLIISSNVDPADIAGVLKKREGISGLDEKASR
ncbi:MAG: phosphoribosyl-ATP diphosphatase [Pseudomonadota bacterium]